MHEGGHHRPSEILSRVWRMLPCFLLFSEWTHNEALFVLKIINNIPHIYIAPFSNLRSFKGNLQIYYLLIGLYVSWLFYTLALRAARRIDSHPHRYPFYTWVRLGKVRLVPCPDKSDGLTTKPHLDQLVWIVCSISQRYTSSNYLCLVCYRISAMS